MSQNLITIVLNLQEDLSTKDTTAEFYIVPNAFFVWRFYLYGHAIVLSVRLLKVSL